MAVFYPSLDEILNNKREAPTPGEAELLKFLDKNLKDDSFEIYFQPYLNMLHPDIIIVKRRCGVFIIEVKDWNLNYYTTADSNSENDDKYKYITTNQNEYSKSPTKQVDDYRTELFKLCREYELGNKIEEKISIKNSNKKFGIKNTVFKAVYFHSETNLNNIKRIYNLNDYGNCTDQSYAYIWHNCNFNKNIIFRIQHDLNPDWTHNLFNDKVYYEVHSLLNPSIEQSKQSQPFKLNAKQSKLSESRDGAQMKIAGVAGSGKTLVLAQRAVNAHERTGKRVLIITYNITLRQYIYDKIAQVYYNPDNSNRKSSNSLRKNDYLVMNFHSLISSTAKLFDSPFITYDENDNNYDKWVTYNANYIKRRIREEDKYDAVFIDESQDFKKEWFDIIKESYLKENGEFVIFADEKQDIYNNTALESEEAHRPKTNIPGRWIKLEGNYRMSPNISKIVSDFSLEFFDETYENRTITSDLIELPGQSVFRYFKINERNYWADDVCNVVNSLRNDKFCPISPNDIAILSYDHAHIRELEQAFNNIGMAAETTSETVEEYNNVVKSFSNEMNQKERENKTKKELQEIRNKIKKELQEIRKIKKSHFYMNRGCLKMSTINSFKGWEIDTVVLLLDSIYDSDFAPKNIYTAISRARRNLVIIDFGANEKLSEFFRNETLLINGLTEYDEVPF